MMGRIFAGASWHRHVNPLPHHLDQVNQAFQGGGTLEGVGREHIEDPGVRGWWRQHHGRLPPPGFGQSCRLSDTCAVGILAQILKSSRSGHKTKFSSVWFSTTDGVLETGRTTLNGFLFYLCFQKLKGDPASKIPRPRNLSQWSEKRRRLSFPIRHYKSTWRVIKCLASRHQWNQINDFSPR